MISIKTFFVLNKIYAIFMNISSYYNNQINIIYRSNLMVFQKNWHKSRKNNL